MKVPLKLHTTLLSILLIFSACTGSEKTNEQTPEVSEEQIIKAELVMLSKDKSNSLRLAGPIRKLGGDMIFTEGPVWISSGYLLFSDVPANRIYKWEEGQGMSIFMEPSGLYTENVADSSYLGRGGSNGLLLDNENRLLICQHGNRQIIRIESNSSQTVLASHYQGKRFNSPNDLAIRNNGDIYFTDPPYGLPGGDEASIKELNFNGLYRLANGEVTLLDSTLTRPNGLAFSPDEKYLYVAVSDPKHKVWYRYQVEEDGSLTQKHLLLDVTSETASGSPDGMVVDAKGRLFATGPGGVWVFDADGSLLARIQPEEIPSNCTLGRTDGKTLFMTARTGLYAVEVE